MKKLDRNQWPAGMNAGDFKCYGPPASEDTKFSGTCLADMGCFMQPDSITGKTVDSNKYYHASVVSDKNGSKWFLYVEYGRVGAANPSFQFTECFSRDEAQSCYEKQCAEKNTKRGQWISVAGRQMFRPIEKKGKPEDLYVVRNLAKRDVGLPDAKTITSPDHQPKPSAKVGNGTKKTLRCDPKTTSLMRDLLGGAVTYARTNLVGGAIPAQKAIDDARELLQLARKRVGVVGSKIDAQVADKDLKELTYALYGSIPKVKPIGAPEKDWILSQDNILAWDQDLGAFETALQSDTGEVEIEGDDPLEGFPLDMEWIDPRSEVGRYLMNWWPNASRKRHGYGAMTIKNLWRINRYGDDDRFTAHQDRILSELNGGYKGTERPLHQDRERGDLTPDQRKKWWDSNSALTFHGTRSVNVPGILRTNLRLPKELVGVVITGAMFGPGIYYADDWMKSAGYTSLRSSYWSKGGGLVANREAFMFACDTVMGNPHLAKGPYGYTSSPKGTHCVFGKGGLSGVENNEWITFDRQPVLRYLAEFTTGR